MAQNVRAAATTLHAVRLTEFDVGRRFLLLESTRVSWRPAHERKLRFASYYVRILTESTLAATPGVDSSSSASPDSAPSLLKSMNLPFRSDHSRSPICISVIPDASLAVIAKVI
jgi:hypothetical protein